MSVQDPRPLMRQIREARGDTIEFVARLCGVGPAALRGWETESVPSQRKLALAARYYGAWILDVKWPESQFSGARTGRQNNRRIAEARKLVKAALVRLHPDNRAGACEGVTREQLYGWFDEIWRALK